MIIVLQFREDVSEAHEQECITKHIGQAGSLRFISIFDPKVDYSRPAELLKDADSLIVCGSGALSMAPDHAYSDYRKIDYVLSTTKPLLDYILAHDFPTLGICFGHQLLAQAAGGKVINDPKRAENGSYPMTLTPAGEQDALFAGIPNTFYAVAGHHDSVADLPPGATLLASSEHCHIQAVRYGQRVYSTQFHGELDNHDVMQRFKLFPHYNSVEDKGADTPTPYGPAILKNFVGLEWSAPEDKTPASTAIASI